MTKPFTLADVRQALRLPDFDPYAAQRKLMPLPRTQRRTPEMPGAARLGGVLILLYHWQDDLYVVLTRRQDGLQFHAGQISFPGGRHEPPETLQMTALREAHEEVGVSPDKIEVIGPLTPLYIPPSDFEVHPFVGWYRNGQRPSFTPDSREVAEIIETPLGGLLDPATRRHEPWEWRGSRIEVPYFAIQGHKVWGATAMMLSELVERLLALGIGIDGRFPASP